MAKAYKCYFDTRDVSGSSIVIANNQEEALSIMKEREYGITEENTDIRYISLEKVYLRDLTAGDICRLIKNS